MEYPVLAQKVLAEVGGRSPRTQWGAAAQRHHSVYQ
jgi:hypothetical protein